MREHLKELLNNLGSKVEELNHEAEKRTNFYKGKIMEKSAKKIVDLAITTDIAFNNYKEEQEKEDDKRKRATQNTFAYISDIYKCTYSKEQKKQKIKNISDYYGGLYQMAKEFNVSYSTVKEWASKGSIKDIMLNSLIYKMEVDKYFKQQVESNNQED